MDERLPNGMRLGDATGADLIEASRILKARGREALRRALLLESVGGKVGGREKRS